MIGDLFEIYPTRRQIWFELEPCQDGALQLASDLSEVIQNMICNSQRPLSVSSAHKYHSPEVALYSPPNVARYVVSSINTLHSCLSFR